MRRKSYRRRPPSRLRSREPLSTAQAGGHMTRVIMMLTSLLLAMYVETPGVAMAQAKPNIVIIWGDDIGQSNLSAYTHGLMGYKTPNIDRIAAEGMMFTD